MGVAAGRGNGIGPGELELLGPGWQAGSPRGDNGRAERKDLPFTSNTLVSSALSPAGSCTRSQSQDKFAFLCLAKKQTIMKHCVVIFKLRRFSCEHIFLFIQMVADFIKYFLCAPGTLRSPLHELN